MAFGWNDFVQLEVLTVSFDRNAYNFCNEKISVNFTTDLQLSHVNHVCFNFNGVEHEFFFKLKSNRYNFYFQLCQRKVIIGIIIIIAIIINGTIRQLSSTNKHTKMERKKTNPSDLKYIWKWPDGIAPIFAGVESSLIKFRIINSSQFQLATVRSLVIFVAVWKLLIIVEKTKSLDEQRHC